jgi:hypothetical protein
VRGSDFGYDAAEDKIGSIKNYEYRKRTKSIKTHDRYRFDVSFGLGKEKRNLLPKRRPTTYNEEGGVGSRFALDGKAKKRKKMEKEREKADER